MSKVKFIFRSIIDVIKYVVFMALFSGLKEKNVWLISERGNDARDNGYWLYAYIKDKHPEVTVKYVIASNSPDVHKIEKSDRVKYRSLKHYYRLFTSKYLISAEIMGFTPNERLYYRLNKRGLLRLRGKKIFLQHGITKDYFDYLKKENTKLDLFICGAKREYEFILNKYEYDSQKVALTGFARFDQLYNDEKKIILIIPTWRKWLRYNNTLKGTTFYDMYEGIINSERINKAAKKYGYRVVFYPHPDMQKFINDFVVDNSEICRIASSKTDDMQDLFRKASILITDYSSVAFDMAYLGKKTVYYQFDEEKYRNQQYSEGYYDYNRDGFGPVLKTLDSVERTIEEYIAGKNRLEDYDARIDAFFGKKNKRKNCDHIFTEIKNRLG